jgi:hypothetical protein
MARWTSGYPRVAFGKVLAPGALALLFLVTLVLLATDGGLVGRVSGDGMTGSTRLKQRAADGGR